MVINRQQQLRPSLEPKSSEPINPKLRQVPNLRAFWAGATKAEAAATIRARKKRTRAMVMMLLYVEQVLLR